MAEVVVSRNTFLMGMVIAILASSLLSTVISTQLATGPQGIQGEQGLTGPKGDKGDIGPQGEQGPIGNFTIDSIDGLLPAPAYDSGWVPLVSNQWISYLHNLNTTEVFVYVLGKSSQGINQMRLGDSAYWFIESKDELLLYVSASAEQYYLLIRVQIWKIAQP